MPTNTSRVATSPQCRIDIAQSKFAESFPYGSISVGLPFISLWYVIFLKNQVDKTFSTILL